MSAFAHSSAVERSSLGQISENDILTFDVEKETDGKFSAVNLVKA